MSVIIIIIIQGISPPDTDFLLLIFYGLQGKFPMRGSFSFLLGCRHLAVSGSQPDSRCHSYLSSSHRLGYHSSKCVSRKESLRHLRQRREKVQDHKIIEPPCSIISPKHWKISESFLNPMVFRFLPFLGGGLRASPVGEGDAEAPGRDLSKVMPEICNRTWRGIWVSCPLLLILLLLLKI